MRKSRVARRLAELLPGLAAVAVATAVAFAVSHVVHAVSAPTAAVLVGALAVNLRLHHRALRPGTHFASHRLMRVAVALLGLQLSLGQLVRLGGTGLAVVAGTVAVTFTGTRWLGRLLGVSRPGALLVATGFSICGASAVAAMQEVADGTEEDTAVAIALVTLCGSAAIFLLPLLRGPLGLDPSTFGSWVGASVHDVGQTVATASRVPGALTAAIVVKLTRVVLLAPLVIAIGAARNRGTRGRVGTRLGGQRPPVLPLFVAGFLAAIVVASTGLVPAAVLHRTAAVQQVLVTAALAGLGTGIHLPTMRAAGRRPLLLGIVSWLLVAATAYAGVRLFRV